MTKIVGIINLTPDSFSDGGQFTSATAAIDCAAQLIEAGADVIDVGAESTRPSATPLSSEEEWARLLPFFAVLEPSHMTVPFSLDTRHAINAKHALDKGFTWINDVSGFSAAEMVAAVQPYDCTLVVMHSLSVPASRELVMPEGSDVVAELLAWFSQTRESLIEQGVDAKRLVCDVGIGFGKTAAQSRTILDNISAFRALNMPLYVGHSRKSFLQGVDANDKDAKTLQWSEKLMQAGVEYVRVHDVAAHVAIRDKKGNNDGSN